MAVTKPIYIAVIGTNSSHTLMKKLELLQEDSELYSHTSEYQDRIITS